MNSKSIGSNEKRPANFNEQLTLLHRTSPAARESSTPCTRHQNPTGANALTAGNHAVSRAAHVAHSLAVALVVGLVVARTAPALARELLSRTVVGIVLVRSHEGAREGGKGRGRAGKWQRKG